MTTHRMSSRISFLAQMSKFERDSALVAQNRLMRVVQIKHTVVIKPVEGSRVYWTKVLTDTLVLIDTLVVQGQA